MPAPSELLALLRVGTDAETADAVTRSHLADGRVVGWYGDPAAVVDAELVDQPVPPALAARFGTEEFWARWTAAECAAKLADVPMHLWLRTHGLTHVGTLVDSVLLDEILVTVGRRGPASSGPDV